MNYWQKDDENGILKLFESNLQTLLQDGQIGTFKTYNYAYNAFKRFRNGKDINPADISPQLLQSFENYLLTPKLWQHRKTLKAANKTTVAIYMRSLKKILNIAIDQNPSLKAFYPFSQRKGEKNRYTIRTGSGKKGEALKIDELQKFISLETQPGTPEHEAKLLWLFSFHCQGMNFPDISYLKYSPAKLHR